MTEAQAKVHKGLAGVIVDTTAISKVVPETNSLTYRGYPVQDLATTRSFEEIAYLLWHGELPDAAQLAQLEHTERALREIDRSLLTLINRMPENCHPMDVVRTAISWLGAQDPSEDDRSPDANLAKAIRMTAQLPTVVAADQRRRHGFDRVPPRSDLGFAENFLYMSFGELPRPEVLRAFETSLILYAEHSFNASTFTARVVTSTLSDIYSAVTAAIGALKGPLHGGANEAVMHTMLEIGEPERAAQYVRDAVARKEKLMGFGHRVYKNGDSRVPTMRATLGDLVAVTGGEKWLAMYDIMEAEMVAATGIKPNLDFPTGPAYYLMGFDIDVFTPLFVMARITGWTAHIIEQSAANALIRPLSEYVGFPQRAVPRGAVAKVAGASPRRSSWVSDRRGTRLDRT